MAGWGKGIVLAEMPSMSIEASPSLPEDKVTQPFVVAGEDKAMVVAKDKVMQPFVVVVAEDKAMVAEETFMVVFEALVVAEDMVVAEDKVICHLSRLPSSCSRLPCCWQHWS